MSPGGVRIGTQGNISQESQTRAHPGPSGQASEPDMAGIKLWNIYHKVLAVLTSIMGGVHSFKMITFQMGQYYISYGLSHFVCLSYCIKYTC